MTSQQNAWKKYVTNFSENTASDVLSYGDKRMLLLDSQWNEKIQQLNFMNLMNQDSQSLYLDGNNSTILSQYLEQMTAIMIEKAKVHKDVALTILSKLTEIIKEVFLHSEYEFLNFHLFGSTVNCLALESSSDLDFVLMIRHQDHSEIDPKKIFDKITASLNSTGFIATEQVLKARVPLLCLKDMNSNLEIDISINNPYGVKNTKLIGRYLNQDSRLQSLLLLIKKWTKAKGIANTHNSTISSYSWTLLAIHFLLVYKFKNTTSPLLSFVPLSDLEQEQSTGIHGQNQVNPERANVNLAQLFIQFFIYYGIHSFDSQNNNIMNSTLNFDPNQMFVPKTASSQLDPEARVNDRTPNWRLSLIDPIDTSHNLGSCIQRCEGQSYILTQLNDVVELLRSFISSNDTSNETSIKEFVTKIFEINTNVINLPKLCSMCQSEDHMSRSCPDAICYNCGQKGHISSDCAQRICYRCRKRHQGRCQIDYNLLNESSAFPKFSGNLLLETVLHWNIDTVIGSSLLPQDIRPIPMIFDSSMEWFNTFYPFILEEIRISWKGLIENYEIDNDEQFALQPLITSLSQPTNSEVLTSGEISFPTENDLERGFIDEHASGVGIFINKYSKGNLVDILKKNPHFFVHIGFPNSPTDTPPVYQCDFPRKLFLKNLQESNCSDWKLIILGSELTGSRRVCDALAKRIRPYFMKDILRGKVHEYQDNTQQIGNLDIIECLDLNDSQKSAIKQVLQVGQLDHPPIQIIKGPPGTGKTRTISHLIDALVASNLRVHATAPTNIAVSELAKRFILTFPHRKSLIIGTIKRLKLDEELLQFHFETKLTKIHSSVADLSSARQRLITFVSIKPSEIDLFEEFVKLIKTLKNCITVLQNNAPLGLIEWKNNDENIHSNLNYLLKISNQQFHDWLELSDDQKKNGENLIQEKVVQVISFLRGIRIIEQVLGNLKKVLLLQSEVYFSTVNVGGRDVFSHIPIDVTIVDEATQLLQGDIATIFRSDLKCLVLVGDEKQLPAVVYSEPSKALGYGLSLFDRLIHLDYPSTMLNIQYRMHPLISRWPSEQFYSGNILNGENVLSEKYNKSWHNDIRPLELYDIRDGSEDKIGTSLYHDLQAMLVRRITTFIKKITLTESSSVSIGIISPYKQQILKLSHLATSTSKLQIKVCTIDGFQGQEADIIILTTVRSNSQRKIGFLSDLRRLNVAITRSRYSLILVGDIYTISSNHAWANYIEEMRNIGIIHTINTNNLIKGAVKSSCDSSERFEQLLKMKKDPLEDAPWKIIFANEFQKSFLQKEFLLIKSHIIQKILDLASGVRLKWESKSNCVNERYQEIIHIQKIHKYFLIWTVDVDRKSLMQCIQIWDIVEYDKISKVICRIEHMFDKYSDLYLQRCKESCHSTQTKKYEPVRWNSNDPNIVWYKKERITSKTSRQLTPIEKEIFIPKFYRLSAEVANLLLSESTQLDLPFEMSPEEDLIVKTHLSMFILGRSGTGKTTVLLHRMYFENKKIQHINVENIKKIPQILITISPILCKAIKRSYQSLIHETGVVDNETNSNILLDEEEENIGSKSLCSLANNEEFPLIITYKTFLLLLDNCLPIPFFKYNSITKFEVNFERYESHYYPRCKKENQKFDSNFIFKEIFSNIKGSLKALQSMNGRLSEQDYLQLSTQKHSILSFDDRQRIYFEFEKYEKLKSINFDYDLLDIVHYVYQQLSSLSSSSSSKIVLPDIHSMFVDEVQDLTPAQIALFKFVCKNPNGYVFAGDTAQTIAPGVGFRFESIRDVFFYEIFPEECQGENENVGPRPGSGANAGPGPGEGEQKSKGNGKGKGVVVQNRVPNFYHLKQNFRTHSRVVNLANSVVDLIVKFFPSSIDKLDPEFSLLEGPLPIYLSSSEDVVQTIFSNSSGNKRLQCGFGAEQVILVRDEINKERVKKMTQNNSLVLTVLECKGMEFTDCLVYNFFSTSAISNDWRALYELIDPEQPHPQFDAHLHSSICTELKLLYVLLTRSRSNLVIYDEQLCQQNPLYHFWMKRELINVCEYDESIRNIFVKNSTPEEWKARGNIFLNQRQFSNARHCFQLSGDFLLERLCEAGEYEQKADKISSIQPQQSVQLYQSAALIYFELPDQLNRAAKCFELGKDFHRAGDLYFQCQQYQSAASCYVACNQFLLAIEAYIKSSNYQDALLYCKKIGAFEKAIEIIEMFSHLIGQEQTKQLKDEWIYKAAINYNSKSQRKKAVEIAHTLSSNTEKRKFYERYSYFEELRNLSIEEGKYEEIGSFYERKFLYLEAVDCYESGRLFSDAARCLLKIIRPYFLNSTLIYEYDRMKVEPRLDLLVRLESISKEINLKQQNSHDLEIFFLLLLRDSQEVYFNNFILLQKQPWSPFKLRFQIFQLSHLSQQDLKFQCLRDLQGDIFTLIKICHNLSKINNLNAIPKNEMMLCLELFNYFELIPNHGIPIHANKLLGLKNTFPDFQTHFPATNDAPDVASNVFSISISFFAKRAIIYFVNLFHYWCEQCTSHLQKTFENNTTETTTLVDRYYIATFLDQIYLKNDLFDLFLTKNKIIQRNLLRKKIRHFFCELILSTPLTIENSDLILLARRDERLLNYVSELCDDLSVDCQNREDFTTALLLTDFTNNQRQITERLSTAHEEIFKDSNHRQLLTAFQWQNEKHVENTPSSLPTDWIHGEFLYSVDIGVNAILSELWYKSINKAAWGGYKKINCMSPYCFLDLVEKYYVWLQLCSKHCRNVIFPSCLLRNIICRKSTGYANVIKGYQQQQQSGKTSDHCNRSLSSLVVSLLEAISQLTPIVIQNWAKASKIQVPDHTALMHTFTDRLIMLIYNYLLNIHPQNRHRISIFEHCRFYLSHNLGVCSPNLLNKMRNFQFKIENLYKVCVPFFASMNTPLECFDIRLGTCDNPRSTFNSGIHQRGIITVEADNCVAIVPPQHSTVEIPFGEIPTEPEAEFDVNTKFVEKSDAIAAPPVADLTIARSIFAKYRKYREFQNSTLGFISRSIKKYLLENLIDIDSNEVDSYLRSICRLIEKLQDKRNNLHNRIEILKSSENFNDAENLDYFCDKLIEMDKFIGQLLIPVEMIPFLQDKTEFPPYLEKLQTAGKLLLSFEVR